MSLTLVAALAAVLGALAVVSAVGVSRLERAHPPAGRFVEVEGVKLHVLELGTPSREGGLAIVLIHGASGNLEDMRLALGDELAKTHRVILVDRPGHGWSERADGSEASSPARQAALIAGALDQLGVRRAVLVSHSWAGALATAYTLAFPDRVAGLVLISPVTHPWPGGLAWYYNVATTPIIGPLFAYTLALPVGSLVIEATSRGVFAPGTMPAHYVRRAAIDLVLRPKTFLANARDVKSLKAFVAAQVPRYGTITAPTVIITGDDDTTVSPQIHARALTETLPNARLVMLSGVGHMPHHLASDVVVRAIDEVAATGGAPVAARRERIFPES